MSSDNPELENKEAAAVEPATKADRQQRAERARALLGQLAERYPACFHRDPQAVRPLEIGIQQKLRADLGTEPAFADTPGWLIRQALAIYTRSAAYVRALVERRPRVGLDGSTSGEVSDQEHAHALERQAEIDARRAARPPRRGKPPRKPQDGEQAPQPEGEQRRPRRARPQGEGPRPEGQRRRGKPSGPPRGERPRPARPQSSQPAEPPVIDPAIDASLSPEERTRLKLEALAKKFSRE